MGTFKCYFLEFMDITNTTKLTNLEIVPESAKGRVWVGVESMSDLPDNVKQANIKELHTSLSVLSHLYIIDEIAFKICD